MRVLNARTERAGASSQPDAACESRAVSVLHLITGLDRGGAETTLCRLLSKMDRGAVTSIVASLTGPGPLASRLAAQGIPSFTLGGRRLVGPLALWRLARLIRRRRPDVLQTWLYHADLFGLVAGRALRVPAIAWNLRCADLDPADHPKSLFWVLRLLAWSSRIPDVVIANSTAGLAVHERLGYSPRRWELIPNGFDTNELAPSEEGRRSIRREWGVADATPLVGLIARYHPMKDHRTFLDAAARVAALHPDARFILAGWRVNRENRGLMGLIETSGLTGRVMVLGELDGAAAALPALDVAVSSSYSEAFPNVVGEAMACGVPVVATSVGDTAKLVGDTAFLVPPRDPARLSAAISRMLALPPEERRARGLAGRRRVIETFSLDAVAGRYEQLYLDLARRVMQRT